MPLTLSEIIQREYRRLKRPTRRRVARNTGISLTVVNKHWPGERRK